jgi:hypothetical protein
MTTATPTIIRASSLSGYPDCPRRSAARMFRAEIIAAGHDLRDSPRSIGAAVGTAVHKAASVMLIEKAKTGSLPPLSTCHDAAVETVKAEAADGMLYDRETPALNEAQTQVVRMATVYHHDVAPDIQPLIVEERMEADVAPGVVLSGQSDVIAREPGRVRDLKTGKMLGNHKPQLGAYSLLGRSNGIDVTEAGIDFVQRVPLKKPQPGAVSQVHDVAAAETAATNIIRHIQDDLQTFRRGDPVRGVLPGDPWAFPANPSSMLCSAKWCTAFGTTFCREHQEIEEE